MIGLIRSLTLAMLLSFLSIPAAMAYSSCSSHYDNCGNYENPMDSFSPFQEEEPPEPPEEEPPEKKEEEKVEESCEMIAAMGGLAAVGAALVPHPIGKLALGALAGWLAFEASECLAERMEEGD